MARRAMLLCGAVCFIGLLLSGCGDDDSSSPRVDPNKVTVESVTAAPGDHITVDVTLHNVISVQVVEVPIRFVGTGCTVDSVVFSPDFSMVLAPFSWTDADPDPLEIDMINTLLLAKSAGDYTFATIYMTIDAQAAEQTATWQTYTYTEDQLFGTPTLHKLSIASPSQAVAFPTFEAGTVTIVQP